MRQPQAIICSQSARLPLAESLAEKYKLPLLNEQQGQLFNGVSLVLDERVQIHNPEFGAPLKIDFTHRALLSRLQAGNKQPIGRACGLHKNKNMKILDCTAGMGQDMLTLASMGARVTPIERNDFIHLMLIDAFTLDYDEQIVLNSLANCIQPEHADACEYISAHEKAEWDVIYIDPMFSGYRRKALPKKSMQIFAELCGPDDDADKLLDLALTHCGRRVVAKRSTQAPFLSGRNPAHQIKGKSLRFDVYIAEN